MSTERRRTPRFQFIADAELIEIRSGSKSHVKTGDLSAGGCFLDTLNPLPEATEIQVTIIHGHQRFIAVGRVVFAFPRLGVGVVFTQVAPDQRITLEGWLADLERGRCADVAAGLVSHKDNKS
ncbi:MAG: PilZ domain-containing protein [Candidatus Acidiferrum sp.]